MPVIPRTISERNPSKVSLNTVTRMLHNRRYIGEYQYRDTFINKILLWDDGRIYFGCNYKNRSREMTYAELKEADVLGSDISALGAPKIDRFQPVDFLSIAKAMVYHHAIRVYIIATGVYHQPGVCILLSQ